METAHLHLISNHVPVFALFFSIILLVVGELLKNKTLLITALAGFIIAAIASVIAFITGEEAEHLVESIAGIGTFVEQHKEMAKPANFATVVLGVMAVAGVTIEIIKNRIPVFLKRTILLVSLIAVVLISYTAYLGGQIRHTEIRNNYITTETQNDNSQQVDDD